jgi:methyltransferase-like protein
MKLDANHLANYQTHMSNPLKYGNLTPKYMQKISIALQSVLGNIISSGIKTLKEYSAAWLAHTQPRTK